MKTLKLALAALSLTLLTQNAVAEKRDYNTENCLFGQSAGMWAELQNDNGEAIFNAGESISLHTKGRENGLTAVELQMLQLATGAENQQDALKMFLDLPYRSNAGRIDYFVRQSDYRTFAEVYYYPGDNQYGVIVEIKNAYSRTETPTAEVVADIGDGELYNCRVQK